MIMTFFRLLMWICCRPHLVHRCLDRILDRDKVAHRAVEDGRVKSHARVFDDGGVCSVYTSFRFQEPPMQTPFLELASSSCDMNSSAGARVFDAHVAANINEPHGVDAHVPMQTSSAEHGQGLGSKAKCRYLHNLIRLYRLSVVVVIEPKVVFDPDFYGWHFGMTLVARNCSNHIWVFCASGFSMLVEFDYDQLLHRRLQHFLTDEEVENGVSDRYHEMMDFGDAISDCQLLDLGFDGAWFTWEWPAIGLRERLDRILLGEFWTSVFAVTRVTHLARHQSDHAPLLVRCQFLAEIPKSFFRFQNMWVRHHTFRETVLEEWQTDEAMSAAQAAYDSFPSPEARAELNHCVAYYVLRTEMEKDFWKQKVAVRWVVDGERNSRFFQGWVKQKRYKSRIHVIEDGRHLAESDFSCLQEIPPEMDTGGLCVVLDVEEHCWDFVGGDVVGAVEYFFSGSYMPHSFTATIIVLLPKNERAVAWTDYRPISLCNVTNKIIMKILTTRLDPFLPTEMIGDLHISRAVPNVALKLDMSKAYDMVQWLFLLGVLRHIGFPDQWIAMINSAMVFKTAEWGFPISHISYADDIIIFTRAAPVCLTKLMDCLKHYSAVSGQLVNRGKSNFYIMEKFVSSWQQQIQSICGYQCGSFPFTYLGVGSHQEHLGYYPAPHLSGYGAPQGVLQQLKEMIAQFFWDSIEEQRKFWKLWWRFKVRDSLWARYMWQKYCGPLYPERVPLSVHDSRVSFWDDVWFPNLPLSAYCPAIVVDHCHVDWYLSAESWSIERLHALSAHYALLDYLIDFAESDSCWYRRPERVIFGSFWHDGLTPTISIFLWHLMHGRIPVDVRLQSRRIHLASCCQCCVDPQIESIEHVFLWSESAKSVWAYIVRHHHRLLVSAGKLLSLHWLGCYPQIKLNTDGSFSVDLQMAAGGGGLVRDSTRALLAGFCVLLRVGSSFDAEFQSLLHGLRLAVQYSDHIWIEMDVASVVSVLQSGHPGSAVTRHTLTSIHFLCCG
ncbi:hypothetical protein C2S52_020178 [Perilla frutescens var. hirtella]|nr:hypothetical protein C2S52_020178 [Perilla frutescens var. hirtella]